MIGKEIVSSRPATIAEVKETMEAQKAARELGFEQQVTLEYSQKVAKTDAKKSLKLVAELEKMEKLTPDMATKVADMMPANKEQLMVIVSKDRYTLNDKEVEQVLGILHGKAKAEKSED
jgi:DNA-directed RNA polymerase subunit F